MLQYQSSMFSDGFGEMLADTAAGNPGVVGRPITWNASLVEHHLVLLTRFSPPFSYCWAAIAWRPPVRVALAASIAWSLGVWWFGEGLGMVLTGDTSPVDGAPGAVIFYALLAVLLSPADRPGVARAVRGGARGGRPGRPGAVARAVAQPGLLRAAAGEPGPQALTT